MNDDLEWYEGPEIASPEALADLSGSYRPDSLIVSYAFNLENRAHKKGLSALSAREQLVVAGAVFEREVNSGGFQSFLDDYGVYLDAAKLSMKAMEHGNIETLINDAARAHRDTSDASAVLETTNEKYYDLAIDLADDLIRLATS